MTITRPTWKAVDVGDTYSHDDVNQFLFEHDQKLAYTGTSADGNIPADNTSADITPYHYASRFTMPSGKTALDRVQLKLIKAGTGVDLTGAVQADSAGSPSGTNLASRTIPKQWVPTSATVISVALPVTGLTALANYWIVVAKAGDGTNNCKWRSLNAADASHPAKNSATGGAGTWSAALTEEMHVDPYYNDGTGDLVNIDEDSGVGQQWLQYTGSDLTKIAGRREDLRMIQTLTYAASQLVTVSNADAEA